MQNLSEAEKFKFKHFNVMIKMLKAHPYSFMFNYLDPVEQLTLDDIQTSVKKQKIEEFTQMEILTGKLFDQVEQNLSEMHGEINQIINKAKSDYVINASK